MSAPPIPLQCSSCRHLRGLVGIPMPVGRGGEVPVQPACAAFPRGIPEDIQDGTFDHEFAHAGDGGLLFAPNLHLAPSP